MTDHRYTNSLASILYKASGAKKKIREAPEDAAVSDWTEELIF